MSDSGASSEKTSLKSLIFKGVVSGVALAGTTAIPIVVQQSLQGSSTPAPSPTVAATASPSPAAVVPESLAPQPAMTQMQSLTPLSNDKPGKKAKKGKKDN